MTEALYLRDSYLREFDGTVTAAEGGAVALDRTALYPGGGGLPPDLGVLRWTAPASSEMRAVPVVEVKRDGETIWHRLEGEPPAVGMVVRGELNWTRRYAVMRHHTAIHVLCGVVYQLFGALATGGQIYPDRARIDFSLEDLTKERVRQIEDAANQTMGEGRPIIVRFMPRIEFERYDLIRTAKNLVPAHLDVIRVVEIEGFDAQADGGTHVVNTKEIGRLRVVKTENKGKINRRLEIALEP